MPSRCSHRGCQVKASKTIQPWWRPGRKSHARGRRRPRAIQLMREVRKGMSAGQWLSDLAARKTRQQRRLDEHIRVKRLGAAYRSVASNCRRGNCPSERSCAVTFVTNQLSRQQNFLRRGPEVFVGISAAHGGGWAVTPRQRGRTNKYIFGKRSFASPGQTVTLSARSSRPSRREPIWLVVAGERAGSVHGNPMGPYPIRSGTTWMASADMAG